MLRLAFYDSFLRWLGIVLLGLALAAGGLLLLTDLLIVLTGINPDNPPPPSKLRIVFSIDFLTAGAGALVGTFGAIAWTRTYRSTRSTLPIGLSMLAIEALLIWAIFSASDWATAPTNH